MELGTMEFEGTQKVVLYYNSDDTGSVVMIVNTPTGCKIDWVDNDNGYDKQTFIESVEVDLGLPVEVIGEASDLYDCAKSLQQLFTDEMVGTSPRLLRFNGTQYLGSVDNGEGKAFVWPHGSSVRPGIANVSRKLTGNIECPSGLQMKAANIQVVDTTNFTVIIGSESYQIVNGSSSGSSFLLWYM